MRIASSPLNRQRLALLGVFMCLCTTFFMLTYSARIESTDTLFMFDATASLVRFGDMRLDMSAGERRYWEYEDPLPDLPLLPVNAEPLQMILAAPLYGLADVVPGIGYVHAVWLFNVFVCALLVTLFAVYALHLGYHDCTAILGAGLLGTATIIWPYSKTFFQEPLTALLLLLTALWAERWRQKRYRSMGDLFGLVFTFALAILARRAVLIALPALILVILPPWPSWKPNKTARAALLLLLAAAVLGLFAVTRLRSVEALQSVSGLGGLSDDVLVQIASLNRAMHAYLFSIGGSVIGTSPVLLLAVIGTIALIWQGRVRYALVPFGLLLAYAAGYAYVGGNDWFGGLSWPPRFLVPTVPFLMLAALPVIDALLNRERPRWTVFTWVVAAPITLYSLWIQVNAVSYWWGEYTDLLPPQAGDLIEWGGGLYDVRYLRWVLLPQLWGDKPFDFAWVRTGSSVYPLLFVVVGALAALVLVWLMYSAQTSRRQLWAAGVVLPLITLTSILFALRLIYRDDFYLAFSSGLNDSIDIMRAELNENDIVVLSTLTLNYERFFLNYSTLSDVRVIGLPTHPGERPSLEQPPQVESPNPGALLTRPSVQLLESISADRDRLWLLSNSSPFITWAVRPAEQYMTQHFFPLRTFTLTGDDGLPVRLIEYVTTAEHTPFTLAGPTHTAQLRYGDAISLLGFNLPDGMTYTPGAAIPVSLYWMADTPPPADYVVTLHLAQDGVGVLASGEDSQPAAGFATTTSWQANQPVWDNRAVRLPPDIAPGKYQLWVGLYGFSADGQPELLPVTGADTTENSTLGVLPVNIQIDTR